MAGAAKFLFVALAFAAASMAQPSTTETVRQALGVLCLAPVPPVARHPALTPSPLRPPRRMSPPPRASQANRYIVSFDKDIPQAQVDSAADEVVANGGQILRRFTTVLHGFSASIPSAFVPTLRQTPGVTVEGEGIVRAATRQPMKASKPGQTRV